MLRSVLAIAFLGACHSAPAPTFVRARPPIVAAPGTHQTPVRQDFEVVLGPSPLAEVIATGHECKPESSPVERPMPGTFEPTEGPTSGPIDDTNLHPIERPLNIMAKPTPCQAERHQRLLVRAGYPR